MDIRPIRTDADHRLALQEIERLWEFPDDSPENDRLDVLATLVAVYEKTRGPIDAASPSEILAYAVKEMGRTQSDLASVLGSQSLASELLAGKKRISLDAARKISAAWKIPIQLLISDDTSSSQTTSRESAKTDKTKGASRPVGARSETVPAKPYGLCLDRTAVELFMATGPGWENRVNDALGTAARKLKKKSEKRAG